VIVAVLDTGCDTNIMEFRGRTVPGTNFVAPYGLPNDVYGHGTVVASIVCANANKNTNIAGLDWNCRLMPVKVIGDDGTAFYSDWAQGVYWAVNNGARVINLSAGGTAPITTDLSEAIAWAVSNGAVFVTVTHNQNTNGVTVPGTHPDAIAVGGSDREGRRWTNSPTFGSNYGTNIALVAPAFDISFVGMGGITGVGSGTSVAAPQVAGVASLILSIRPDLDSRQVRDLLCEGADDRVSADPLDTEGYDLYYGWGRLNAYRSLWMASFVVTNPVAGERIRIGRSFSIAWTGVWPLGTVDVGLWKGTDFVRMLTNGLIAQTNNMDWDAVLRPPLAGGTDYWVTVTGTNDPADRAVSAKFSVINGGLPWLNLLFGP
jgi:subtilisin family serine protease